MEKAFDCRHVFDFQSMGLRNMELQTKLENEDLNPGFLFKRFGEIDKSGINSCGATEAVKLGTKKMSSNKLLFFLHNRFQVSEPELPS